MAGLEGIDAASMELVDALQARFAYDVEDRLVRPVLKHTDFAPVAFGAGPKTDAPPKDDYDNGSRYAVDLTGPRIIDRVRFGLPVGPRIITNARDDKLDHSPAWKGLMKSGRCLTAVSYVVERGPKATYRIQRRDGALMVIPGLIGRRTYTFSSTGNTYEDLGHVQVTAPANDFVKTIHDRFVVELDAAAREAWMDPAASLDDLLQLLQPAPNDAYEMVPLASDVWTRKNDPEATQPTGPAVTFTGKQSTLF